MKTVYIYGMIRKSPHVDGVPTDHGKRLGEFVAACQDLFSTPCPFSTLHVHRSSHRFTERDQCTKTASKPGTASSGT